MWGNPRQALRIAADVVWNMSRQLGYGQLRLPQLEHPNLPPEVYDNCAKFVEWLNAAASTSQQDFREEFSRFVTINAQRIEREQRYRVLSDLYRATEDYFGQLGSRGEEARWIVGIGCVISSLKLMLGSERRLLVGVKAGQPAWLKLDQPLTADLIEDLIRPNPTGSDKIEYIGQDDIDMFPPLGKWWGTHSDIRSPFWPQPDVDEARALFEQAFLQPALHH